MMNFHKEYKIEHEGVEILETEYGFATYKFYPESLCLMELYVTPSERGKGKAQELINTVTDFAKEMGVAKLFATIDPNDKNQGALEGALTKAGMKMTKTISADFNMYEVDVCHG